MVHFAVFLHNRTLHLCFLWADELFAALPRYFDQPGLGTAHIGQWEFMWAQGHTPNSTVQASALVLAIWLEGFPILVNLVVVLTSSSIRICCLKEKGKGVVF